MNVTALPAGGFEADEAVPSIRPGTAPAAPFVRALEIAGATLDRADRAERAFAAHRGGLAEMVFERAAADVALSLATTAAQRATQAVSTIFGMQV